MAGASVDALNPKGPEVALFGFAIAVAVFQPFFNGVFGYRPDVFAAAIIATRLFHDFFTTSPGGY